MIICYYSHANIFGRCIPQEDDVWWNCYGSDCIWMVPGTFDDEGRPLAQW